MDDLTIIAEDYLLKQGVQVGVQRQDVATNQYYNDIGFANYVRLIGTEKQIEERDTPLEAKVHLAIWKARALESEILPRSGEVEEGQFEYPAFLPEEAAELGLSEEGTPSPLEFIEACYRKNKIETLEAYLVRLSDTCDVRIGLRMDNDNEIFYEAKHDKDLDLKFFKDGSILGSELDRFLSVLGKSFLPVFSLFL